MKAKKIIYFFCLLLLFSSCKKAKQLLNIPFDYTTSNDFTLPKISDQVVAVPDSVITIQTPDITNTAPDEFKSNHANINMIQSLSIQSFNLTIKSPPGQDFGFMKSINVYLGATGVGETLIASKDNINTISPAPTSLSLTPTSADITPYIKGATYYLKVQTSIVRTYTQDIDVNSTIQFHAVANPLD